MVTVLNSGSEAAAFEDDADQVVTRIVDVLFGQFAAPGDAADLGGEVGVVLGAAPEQENQVDRIHRVHFTGVDPCLKHTRPALEPGPVIPVEILAQAFAATDDFHGEHPRRLRMATGEFHLGANVAGQRFGRIIVGGEGVEGAVPQLDDVAQHADVQAQLVGEVVMQVSLGQPGVLRNGIHAGAFETMPGELDFRGLENGLFVLLTNTAGGFAAVCWDFKGHGRFRAGQ